MGALASLGGDLDISCQRMAALTHRASPTGHEHHPERNECHIPRKVSEDENSPFWR